MTAGRALKFLLKPLIDAFTVEDVRTFETLNSLSRLHTIKANATSDFRACVCSNRGTASSSGARVFFLLDFFKSVGRYRINCVTDFFFGWNSTAIFIQLIIVFKQSFIIFLTICILVKDLKAWLLLLTIHLREESASLHLLLLELSILVLRVYLNINTLDGIQSMLDVSNEILVLALCLELVTLSHLLPIVSHHTL